MLLSLGLDATTIYIFLGIFKQNGSRPKKQPLLAVYKLLHKRNNKDKRR
jgi:hypothetical protein